MSVGSFIYDLPVGSRDSSTDEKEDVMLPAARPQCSCSPGHLPHDHSLLAIWTSQGTPGSPVNHLEKLLWHVSNQETLVWEVVLPAIPAVHSAL